MGQGTVRLSLWQIGPDRVGSARFSGGGEAQIHFTKGVYRYILFDKTVRSGFGAESQNDPQFSAGLIVQKNGQRLTERLCSMTTGAFINADLAAHYLEAGEYIEH